MCSWQARGALALADLESPVAPPAKRSAGVPRPTAPWKREWFERNRFLVVFALLASFMGTSVGMAQVATSLYAVELGSSGTWLGLIAGAQSIGVVFMSLPVGMLVDRFGPARPF